MATFPARITVPLLNARAASRSLFDAVLSLTYPRSCSFCDLPTEFQSNGPLCTDCWNAVDSTPEPWNCCYKCDQRLAPLVGYPGPRFCGSCRDLTFAHARAVGSYRGPLKEAVVELKRSPHACQRLVDLLHTTMLRLPGADQIDAIIPVPLHPSRERRRSFNQAEVIAAALSRRTGIASWTGVLVKRIDTERHRAGMDAGSRARSMQNAFAVRSFIPVRGRNLMIVDDLVTTGATAGEMATTLLAAGAHSVCVLSIARAVQTFH